MSEKNSTILTNIYLNGTNDYQQRIPDPTQHSISDTMNALFDPLNADLYNQFIDQLVNRIGFVYVRGKAFENPLKVFKDGKMNYGSTIEEIAPNWVNAHSYVDNAEDVFKMHRPGAEVWYHSQNRRDLYPITINHDELRTAFTDEYGLNKLVSKIMQSPINSDEYDEFNIMKQLIAEYDRRWGFYKHHLTSQPIDEDSGKEFLRAIRTYAGKLKFPSTIYNAKVIKDIPIFAKREELVLFVTPETQASLSVEVLASLFNMNKADVNVRQILVDEFPIPNATALLTTEDFFVCKDTLYQNASQYNAKTLGTNYYLHHWGIYSVSPFVPAILFTTEAGTNINTITMTPSELKLESETDEIYPGGTLQLHTDLAGSITKNDDNIEVKPDSVTYEITAEDGVVNLRTRVDQYNRLHLQKHGIEPGDKLNITATSTYTNPSGQTGVYTDTIEINVVEKEITPEDTVDINYHPINDSSLGIIPSDSVIPATENVTKNTTGVVLHALPETAWETDDGTPEGTPGTWAITGWFDNPAGTGTAKTTIDVTDEDIDLYAKFEFTAS